MVLFMLDIKTKFTSNLNPILSILLSQGGELIM